MLPQSAVGLIAWPKKRKISLVAIALGLLTAAGFGLTDALVPHLSQQSTPAHVILLCFPLSGLVRLFFYLW